MARTSSGATSSDEVPPPASLTLLLLRRRLVAAARRWARVVHADDLVRDVERGLAPDDRRVLLEHHRELLALGDLADDGLQLGEDVAGRVLLLLGQVLLQPLVGLLQLDEAVLEVLRLL